MSGHGDAMDLLRQDLSVDDTSERVNALRRLKGVAASIGASRTRSELLDFVKDQVVDNDELMRVLAEELEEFLPLVGGPAHGASMVEIMVMLCGAEETYVREQAVQTTSHYIDGLDASSASAALTIVQRLCDDDWFPPRIAAGSIMPAVYRRAPASAHADLKAKFVSLCRDDAPMVRRAAAGSLGELSAAMGPETAVQDLVPLLAMLVRDDQESVRVVAVGQVADVAVSLPPASSSEHLLKLVKECMVDRSWRVRHSIAETLAKALPAFGPETIRSELLHPVLALARDPEAEVRAAAAKNMGCLDELAGKAMFDANVVPVLMELLEDEMVNVRSASAQSAMDMVPRSTRSLMTVMERALGDEDGEVRLKILAQLNKLADSDADEEASRRLIATIIKLATDTQWRVRESVIRSLPSLCKSLGPDYFNEHVMALYMAAHDDDVDAVREAAAEVVAPLCHSFGLSWASECLVPAIKRLLDNAKYFMQRIQAISAARHVVDTENAELCAQVLDVPLRGLEDPVPNVRVYACRAMHQLLKSLPKALSDARVRPVLERLMSDSDVDVKFFAGEALQGL
eukprot:CAMPEP_0196782062 /NCGR_PEP_ID=MMETSP1104-20130614/10616_1 /TAXON_ID=33652 /ORGANISM="Cafeteria sp., Strain Caron Lab Isolate" /LENGTH=571 /DNA_ID=CAMNT_0042152293 /DNA_START=26 /DNA_END=1741 /DNA_ORIENTATION=-